MVCGVVLTNALICVDCVVVNDDDCVVIDCVIVDDCVDIGLCYD